VKQITNRIVDLFKGLKTSATLGQEDSSIELPNRTLSVLELPGPLKNAQNAGNLAVGTIVGDSAFFSLGQVRTGAQVLSQVFTSGLLDAGLWHLKGVINLAWNVGAVSGAAQQSAGIQDPDGFTVVLGQTFRVPLTGSILLPVDIVLSLDRPGWRFTQTTDATLAADTVVASINVVANKLL